MSKKVMLKQVSLDITVRDRDVRILDLIERRMVRPGRHVSISLRYLAAELGVSMDTARRGLNSCVKEQFLTSRENRLESGCQVENSYAVTPRGLSVLAAARRDGIVEEPEAE